MTTGAPSSSSKPPLRDPPSHDGSEPESEPNQAPPGSKLAPGLYLVATPIGNLGDLTFRARDLLSAATVIACEDTRVTRKLLTAYEISTPTISYHDHNAHRIGPRLIERMKNGEVVALVSDAGTPLVSDPGYKLVRGVIEADLAVTTLPGPSAALAALCLSGLPSDRFMFMGFLPNKTGARRRALAEVAPVPASLIFYESAHRLQTCLSDMMEILGNRQAAVVREITKKFEASRRARLEELVEYYREAGPPKGEIVIVVDSPRDKKEKLNDLELDALLLTHLKEHSTKDAAALVAEASGHIKRAVYARALALKNKSK